MSASSIFDVGFYEAAKFGTGLSGLPTTRGQKKTTRTSTVFLLRALVRAVSTWRLPEKPRRLVAGVCL
jgi:hypothetical protein